MPQKKSDWLLDENLIALVKKGDMDAMNTLVIRYQKPVFNFVFRMVGDRQNAEDIIQETFLKVLKSLPEYKPKNFKNYIYRIAANTAYDNLRAKKTDISFESEVTIENDEVSELKNLIPDRGLVSPEQVIINSETEAMVQRVLMQIPFEQRQVFIMREFSDMSFNEIAEVTGSSLNTVISRMQYCIKKLKKIMENKL